VVVGVVADILEVVVFASGADALLGIGGAWRIVGGFFGAEEVGNKLIHPGVGEEESGRLWQNGGGGDEWCVLFSLKKSRKLCRISAEVIDGSL